MKKQQQKPISDERKSTLIREKRESVESVKSLLTLRKGYHSIMVSNGLQACFYLFIALYAYSNPEELGAHTIPLLGWNAVGTLISLGTLLFALATFLHYFNFKRRIKRGLRAYCLFTSISATECLESGDKVRAAFFAEKLFEVFPMFARNTKIEIDPWKTSLDKMLEHDVEEIDYSRGAVGPAIMMSENKTLSGAFYSLADQLFSKDASNNYGAVQESLHTIVELTKEYRRKKLTFFDKHSNLKNTLAGLSEYLKLTIAFILSFVLWLTLGYGK